VGPGMRNLDGAADCPADGPILQGGYGAAPFKEWGGEFVAFLCEKV